jgi:hypothetical protein
MRAEAIAKKISCTVVKTSLLHGTGDLSVSRLRDESWQSKPFAPIAQINSPKRAVNIAEVLSEIAPSSRFLDYYA